MGHPLQQPYADVQAEPIRPAIRGRRPRPWLVR
jgi:hypothetical protein